MARVLLSLGSNAGLKKQYVETMVREMARILKPPVLQSRLMETEPVETAEKQEWYINRIVAGSFEGTPRELLDKCQAVESRLGRVRAGFHAPRTADIDILVFGDLIIREKDFVIPHPSFLRRRFCLEGAAEIMPDFVLPGSDKRLKEHFAAAGVAILGQKITFLD
ncbi:MAG: 2-amino-4-hydroxy-6-hydroxymethyldihydropteridine diphosphokinase [Chitinivibrionales bacterium]